MVHARYVLYGAGDAGERDDIAAGVLILAEDEDTVDGVAHERLRAEPDRDTHDADAGEHCADVEAELRKDRQHGKREEDNLGRAEDDAAERLDAPLDFYVGPPGHLAGDCWPQGARDDAANDHRRDDHERQRADNGGAVVLKPAAHVVAGDFEERDGG
jgi:hypothetical protein